MTGTPGAPGLLAHDRLGSTGPALVLLHGLGAERRQPLGLLEPVARQGFQVIAPDLRAHGQSRLDETESRLTFGQLATDVEDLLDALDLAGDVVIVGISMGAATAVELLSRGNLGLRGLLLVRPSWAWEPSPPHLDALAALGHLLRDVGPARAGELFVRTPEFAAAQAVSALAARSLLDQVHQPGAQDRAARLWAIPASAPARPGGVPALPVAVVGCERDAVHPVAIAEQVAADLGADLALVPPRYDAPDEHASAVRAAIRGFAQEVRP